MIFSSLDNSYVLFFRRNKEQISSYSGENVHLFTPMVFDNDVIPDGEWHVLRDNFIRSGIELGSGPSVILFCLRKRDRRPGYDPEYVGAFALPERKGVARLMREFVSICIKYRANPAALLPNLSEMLGKPNLIKNRIDPTEINITSGDSPLHAPTVFLSYSHADSEIVLRAYGELNRHGLRVWLDKYEIPIGAYIFEDVKRGLGASDAALLFLSANSAKSSWLPFEGAFLHGRDTERAIIPIVLGWGGKSVGG